jgi:Mn-dependent DtxR family transcriptional regulator
MKPSRDYEIWLLLTRQGPLYSPAIGLELGIKRHSINSALRRMRDAGTVQLVQRSLHGTGKWQATSLQPQRGHSTTTAHRTLRHGVCLLALCWPEKSRTG